jgi:hypothetical protein
VPADASNKRFGQDDSSQKTETYHLYWSLLRGLLQATTGFLLDFSIRTSFTMVVPVVISPVLVLIERFAASNNRVFIGLFNPHVVYNGCPSGYSLDGISIFLTDSFKSVRECACRDKTFFASTHGLYLAIVFQYSTSY